MDFDAKYTTQKLIDIDPTGEEVKKTILSDDFYVIGEMLEKLIAKIEHVRLDLI
jgi:hypothetical protein